MLLSKILTLAFTLILPLGLVSAVGCSGAKPSDTSAPSAVPADTANSSDSASFSPTSSRLTDEQIKMSSYLGNWSGKINDIKTQQQNKFTFAIQTDIHYYDLDDTMTANNLAALSNFVELDFYANLGDLVRGYSIQDIDSPENMRACMDELVKRYTQNAKCPVMMTVGNHDTNIMWCMKWADHTAQITPAEQLERIYQPLKAHNGDAMVTDEDGSYYYIDFPQKGVRAVMLNTSNGTYDGTDYSKLFTISDKQVEWFKNDALNTDLSVIVMCHTPLLADFPDNGNAVNNSDAIRKAVDDFVTSGGKFVAYFYGHTHSQNVVVEDSGRLHISFGKGNNSGEVVMIDLQSKIINTIGLGSIKDRELKYDF